MYELGDIEPAAQLLQDLIPDQPQNDVLYSATAVMLRRLGHLERAKAILLQGNEATQSSSAEICYNLGLVSLELGELDDAVAYAELAYEKGYPLPGLRMKLQKLGRF
jgi:tetratricopeptide (TPR) repeat protein